MTLACEGHQVHCHRLVLAACSSYFESLLGENPCKHPIIILPRDVKLWEVQALVDFMYKGEVNVSQAGLPDLLKCAEILQIRGLCGSDAALNLNQMTNASMVRVTNPSALPGNLNGPSALAQTGIPNKFGLTNCNVNHKPGIVVASPDSINNSVRVNNLQTLKSSEKLNNLVAKSIENNSNEKSLSNAPGSNRTSIDDKINVKDGQKDDDSAKANNNESNENSPGESAFELSRHDDTGKEAGNHKIFRQM